MVDLSELIAINHTLGAQGCGELLTVILGATPLAIVIVEGDDGRAIYSNDQAVSLAGRPVVGSRAEERCAWWRHADGSPYAVHELPGMRALRGEKVEAEELIFVQPDGWVRHLEVYATPLRASSDDVNRAVVCIWDMTRRKRAEEQLLLKLAELETTVAALPDVYFRIDAAGIILDARSGRTATWAVEQFIGKHLEEAFAPETRCRLQAAILGAACRPPLKRCGKQGRSRRSSTSGRRPPARGAMR